MKITIIILLLLLSPVLFAAGNISITVNDHLPVDSTFYIGQTNLINIRISNDAFLIGMSLGFEFSNYTDQVTWNSLDSSGPGTGYIYFRDFGRAQNVWDLGGILQILSSFNGNFKDSIVLGGAAISGGLPIGDESEILYQMELYIPPGSNTGQICIDNIFIPPGGNWLFNENSSTVTPDYFNCVNTSEADPDCPAVCFAVEVYDTCSGQMPGDADESGGFNVGDIAAIIDIYTCNAPLPSVPANADANGDCIVDSLDAQYILAHLFGGGPAPVACTCLEPYVDSSQCEGTNLCDYSTTDPIFIICPGGDAGFTVTLLDEFGSPVVGESDVWVEFSGCTSIVPCPPNPLTIYDSIPPIASSNSNGELYFYIAGGGCDGGCEANIYAACGLIATVPVKSVDINGDLGVSVISDFNFTDCNDYVDPIGTVDFDDQQLFLQHTSHFCGLSPCDRFTYEFQVIPATNLSPDDDVTLTLTVTNNNFDVCDLGIVSFFSTGFGSSETETFIGSVVAGNIAPGQQQVIELVYTIPAEGAGCLLARFLPVGCCTETIEVQQCVVAVEHCTVNGDICYDFKLFLNKQVSESIHSIYFFEDLPAGWNKVDINIPTSFPFTNFDSIYYQICAPDVSDLGAEASVTIIICKDAGCFDFESFTNRVVVRKNTGDADGSCFVDISDAVYLISFIFGGGPTPLPCQAGDADCSGLVDISDAVYIINFIFSGGPPPCEPAAGAPVPTCGE